MGKTIYISDKDALDVDRVIVSSTGMEYKLLYSCDEIDNYENRLKADLVAMLTEIQLEIEEDYWKDAQGQIVKHDGWNDALTHDVKIIQQKISLLRSKD